MHVNLTHMQVKTCTFLISSWFDMPSTLVKDEEDRELFFALPFMLSAVLTVNAAHVVRLGPGQSHKFGGKRVPSVDKGRANLILVRAVRSILKLYVSWVWWCAPGIPFFGR